ncbi:MAG: SMP-30/gluconolactonase/LRE family protein [Parvibaculum sp.]
MPKYVKGAVYVLLALGFICGVLYWRFLSAAGYFTAVKVDVPADCRAIASVPGPEDIAIDRERGIAYVSAMDRRLARSNLPGAKGVRGGIYTIDLTRDVADWTLAPVTPATPADFRPHGISLFVMPDGARRLFVVNHPADGGQSIDILDVAENGDLSLFKSVTSPLLVSPNDVVAVGPDNFYVTNDHGTPSDSGKMIDDVLLLGHANVVHYDGKTMSQAADGLVYANGINASADGRHIYVASSLGMALHVYDRDLVSGKLTAVDYARLGTGVDNIDVQPDGSLLIAAHPHMLDLQAHAADPGKLSPSQVVRVVPGAQGGGEAATIYLNNGEEISAASVAAGYQDKMLIGDIFDPKILVCHQSREMKAY